MALGPLQDEFKAHAAREAELIAFRQHALDMGMKTGDDATVAGVIKNAAAAAKSQQGDAQEQSERKAKQTADDLLFLQLLDELNRIDNEIDGLQEQIDAKREQIADLDDLIAAIRDDELQSGDAMDDPRVRSAVEAWERKTARTFDPEAENADGVLIAILASEIDELENDIARLADKVGDLKERRAEILNDVDQLQARMESGLSVEAIGSEAEELSSSLEGADVLATEISDVEEVAAVARDGHDGHRDTSLDQDFRVANNEDAFGGIGALFNEESAGLSKDSVSEPTQAAETNEREATPVNPTTPGMTG